MELPRGAHCPSCNIDYDRDFEKNVELSFAPTPSVRPLMEGGFCLSGPMATPHVAFLGASIGAVTGLIAGGFVRSEHWVVVDLDAVGRGQQVR